MTLSSVFTLNRDVAIANGEYETCILINPEMNLRSREDISLGLEISRCSGNLYLRKVSGKIRNLLYLI